jgi:two-component system, sensor histidine kinase LadS
LTAELRRAVRTGTSVGLAIIDVDFFKRFNDAYGHPAGDACLQAIATAFEGALRRPGDLAARWGGEEFVALLPNTDAAGALTMAERICDAVRSLSLDHMDGIGGRVTVSVGAAAVAIPTASDAAGLLAAADAALYEAKKSGRNAARLASSVEARA